ncbi:conserved hypothetical protein [Sphingomonas sp. EC-HK361]|uniref:hypothetical protein n=1 Tax=Sphingomonas sp. EC-HK361 TaxID=2038397 RepID=UPI001256CA45|nr:hypothetical protein [Sphingomonas sp. EC-HK361]VVT14078.1 conserved hypothetical protein [Sphingomonas sp. EC-HK361]
MSDEPDSTPPAGHAHPTRRRALMLGAVGAATVVSIRPALAQTNASILQCEIPVPDAGRAGSYIAADGTVVPANTAGAFPAPPRPIKGEAVRQAMATGGSLPGYDSQRSRAYMNYIRRLQRGTSGFTCFASLQMPRG